MTLRPLVLVLPILLVSLAATACSTSEDEANAAAVEAASEVELSPEELGRLGARLHEQPDEAERILAAAELTWEQLEAAIRLVAEDAETAKRYAEAFRAELAASK
jgi:hypothetical protein